MRLAGITFLIAFMVVLAAAIQTGVNHKAKARMQAERARLQSAFPN